MRVSLETPNNWTEFSLDVQHMTIKERFKRRKRFLLIGVFIGFALFAGVGILENKYPSAVLSAISYAGFFIAFSCIVILVFAFRCPRCNGRVITGAAMGLSLLSFHATALLVALISAPQAMNLPTSNQSLEPTAGRLENYKGEIRK